MFRFITCTTILFVSTVQCQTGGIVGHSQSVGNSGGFTGNQGLVRPSGGLVGHGQITKPISGGFVGHSQQQAQQRVARQATTSSSVFRSSSGQQFNLGRSTSGQLTVESGGQTYALQPIGSAGGQSSSSVLLSGGGRPQVQTINLQSQPQTVRTVYTQPQTQTISLTQPQPQTISLRSQQPSLQNIQLQAPKPQTITLTQPRPQVVKYEVEGGGDSYYDETPQPYSFAYEANDEEGGKWGHSEQSAGDGVVTGSYQIEAPYGYIRIVNYRADADGFHVDIQSNEPGMVDSEPAGVVVRTFEAPAGAADAAAQAYAARQAKYQQAGTAVAYQG